MTLQRIQIGTYANDGTGDTLRASFTKVNDNFLEVYNTLGYQANTANIINAAAHVSTNVIFRHANAAFNQANASFFYATQVDDNMGYAHLKANLAFLAANGAAKNTTAAFGRVNSVYSYANTLSVQINASGIGLRARDNVIFDFANTIYHQLNDSTNGLQHRANLIYSFANGVHEKVNTNFSTTNSAFFKANTAYMNSNASFDRANGAYDYAVTVGNQKLANTSGMSFNGNLFFPTGKVGIGTTDVKQKLDVVGLINSCDLPGVSRSYMGWKSGSPYGVSGLHLINIDNSGVYLGTDNRVRLSVTTAGDVGIGTTSPTAKLEVAGSFKVDSTASFGSFVTVNIPAAQLNRNGIEVLNPDGNAIYGRVTRNAGGSDGSRGVFGQAVDGTGVRGASISGYGVYGSSTSDIGTLGISQTNRGGYFSSSSGEGLRTQSVSGVGLVSTSSSATGVHGQSTSAIGTYGKSTSSVGVWGDSTDSWGGLFRSTNSYLLGAQTASTLQFYIQNDGDLYANAGYGSASKGFLCRAWANFVGSWQSGHALSATITKTPRLDTASITRTNHGFTAGQYVFISGSNSNIGSNVNGVLYSGLYYISAATTNSFTIVTNSRSGNNPIGGTNANCWIWVPTIRGSGNISSIMEVYDGQWHVNFATPMPDANYSVATGVSLSTFFNGSNFSYGGRYFSIDGAQHIYVVSQDRYGFDIHAHGWGQPPMISFAVFR